MGGSSDETGSTGGTDSSADEAESDDNKQFADDAGTDGKLATISEAELGVATSSADEQDHGTEQTWVKPTLRTFVQAWPDEANKQCPSYAEAGENGDEPLGMKDTRR